MKAYALTSGTIFGLIALGHTVKMLKDHQGPGGHMQFVAITLLAALLCVWAFMVAFRPAAAPAK